MKYPPPVAGANFHVDSQSSSEFRRKQQQHQDDCFTPQLSDSSHKNVGSDSSQRRSDSSYKKSDSSQRRSDSSPPRKYDSDESSLPSTKHPRTIYQSHKHERNSTQQKIVSTRNLHGNHRKHSRKYLQGSDKIRAELRAQ